MKHKAIIGLVLACALVVATSARALDADVKVSGTVSSITGEHVMVKTADGKEAMVVLDGKTTITRDKKKVDAKALKAGNHLVAVGTGDANMLMAKTVDVGPAPAKK